MGDDSVDLSRAGQRALSGMAADRPPGGQPAAAPGARSRSCPRCGAQMGESCQNMSASLYPKTTKRFHAERRTPPS
jgi:hypothetical protein